MDKETLQQKIAECEQKKTERLQLLATNDPLWCALQGRIEAYQEMIDALEGGDDQAA